MNITAEIDEHGRCFFIEKDSGCMVRIPRHVFYEEDAEKKEFLFGEFALELKRKVEKCQKNKS